MEMTKKAIQAAAPGWYPDQRCQGLALWVKPAGRRVWVLDYRINGRQRRLTLGRADTLIADEAVKLARKHRVSIDNGRDPLAEREAARRADAANVTLTAFFARYEDEHAKPKKKARSAADDRTTFDRDIKPVLGQVRVPDLTAEQVGRLHRQITARPAPILANRALALLSTMLNLAERWGLRPVNSNPCRHIEKNRERKTHRFLSGEQLTALGKALAAAERAPKESEEHVTPVMLAAIRLLVFTGMRRGEVMNLKWEDVNLEAGVLDLGDSKTGRKLVTLNAPAVQLLDGLAKARRDGEQYVFPGRSPGKPLVGLPKVWRDLRKRAGLEAVRLHDLRHSYASTAAGLGASLPVIGALLGHTVPATTQRYAGLADDPRRQAAEAVGKRLASLLAAPAEAESPVVPLRGRRRRG